MQKFRNEIKVGKTVVHNADLVSACSVRAKSRWLHHDANMEQSVGLCLQAEGYKFRCLRLHLQRYLRSFVFSGKILHVL